MLPGLTPLAQSQPLDKLIPHVGAAPRTLRLLDLRGIKDFGTRCLAASAEGLYNSSPGRRDKVYLVWNDTDQNWADYLLKNHYVRRETSLASLRSLISLTGKRRAIVSASEPFHLNDVATTVAGCENALLVTDPSLLAQYHLKPALDLRDKFKTNVEAYQWLIDTYGSRINRGAASITVPVVTATHNPANLRDYQIANRLYTFWVSGPNEANLPGADSRAETNLATKILTTQIEPNTPVFGYPWSGDGFGPGEGDGVTLLSQTGHFLLPTDNFDNLSVWTCFPAADPVESKPVPHTPLMPIQKYACLYVSDGDNLCTFQEFFPTYWKKLKDKSFPVAWTMAPLLRQVAPPIFDYAHVHIPASDTVGSGVSGVGYMSMEEYGKALGDKKESSIQDFISLTGQATRASGEDWLWVMRYGRPKSPTAEAYGKGRSYEAILGGYGEMTQDPKASIEITGKSPFIHNMFDAVSPTVFEGKLNAFLAKPDCPQVFSVFISNWSFRPADLEKVAQTLKDRGITLVTAEQLGSLARQANQGS